jgi:hypothetical protein
MNKATRLSSSLPALAAVAALSAFTGAARAGVSSCQTIHGAKVVKEVKVVKEAAVTPREPACVKPNATAKLFYTRLGAAALPGARDSFGPDLGLGFRLERGHVGLDASMNLGISRIAPGTGIESVRGSLVKLTGQYIFNPRADASPYLGGGVSWGGETARAGHRKLAGSGFQGQVVAGVELLRSSPIRLFVQADATLPMYLATGQGLEQPTIVQRGALTAAGRAERYLPTVGLSIGIGWGRVR